MPRHSWGTLGNFVLILLFINLDACFSDYTHSDCPSSGRKGLLSSLEGREGRRKGEKKKKKGKKKQKQEKKAEQRTDSKSMTDVLTELVACMADPTSSECTDAFG